MRRYMYRLVHHVRVWSGESRLRVVGISGNPGITGGTAEHTFGSQAPGFSLRVPGRIGYLDIGITGAAVGCLLRDTGAEARV